MLVNFLYLGGVFVYWFVVGSVFVYCIGCGFNDIWYIFCGEMRLVVVILFRFGGFEKSIYLVFGIKNKKYEY